MRAVAPIAKGLDPAVFVAVEDLVAGLARNPELGAQRRHLLALEQAGDKPESLVHDVTLLPRHAPSWWGQSVTHPLGIRCYLSLRKDTTHFEVFTLSHSHHQPSAFSCGGALGVQRPEFRAMNEESKIHDAEFFLVHITNAGHDPNATRYYASALLSAARSALMYARREARGKKGGSKWYDVQVSVDPVVKFLTARRDINIHEQPLPMQINVTVRLVGVEMRSNSRSPILPTPPTNRRQRPTITSSEGGTGQKMWPPSVSVT